MRHNSFHSGIGAVLVAGLAAGCIEGCDTTGEGVRPEMTAACDSAECKSVRQSVVQIVAEQLGVAIDRIAMDSNFYDDLGADSLDTVELVMAVEKKFGMEIPDEKAEEFVTVDKVVRYVADNAPGSKSK